MFAAPGTYTPVAPAGSMNVPFWSYVPYAAPLAVGGKTVSDGGNAFGSGGGAGAGPGGGARGGYGPGGRGGGGGHASG